LWLGKHTPSTKNYLRSELLRLKSKNSGTKSLVKALDIGSSSGEIWKQVASDGWLTSKDIHLEVTLFDANSEAFDKGIQADGLALVFFSGIAPVDLRKFGSETFDLVTAFDIIEHLPKDQGYHLLYELNRLSTTSVIRCPNGFVWQPPFESNPFQAHVSSWTSSELKGLGWNKQYGESGLKWLVGIGTIPHWVTSHSSLRRRFSFLERVPLALSQLLLFKVPRLMAEVVSIRRTRAFDLENHISTKRT
jgi:hypothetical protein